jgi:hypothetical protein
MVDRVSGLSGMGGCDERPANCIDRGVSTVMVGLVGDVGGLLTEGVLDPSRFVSTSLTQERSSGIMRPDIVRLDSRICRGSMDSRS